MKLKIYYRKNLKMTIGKVAAQAVHAAAGYGYQGGAEAVIVLGVSDRKFESIRSKGFVVTDAGVTEVEPGTPTCVAYLE